MVILIVTTASDFYEILHPGQVWYEETDRALYGFHAEQNVRYSSDGAYTIDPHQIPVFLTDSVSVSRVD